jgi:hypothetical protein
MAILQRFRLLLQQMQAREHQPDGWECAVLERVMVALTLGRKSANPGEAESWRFLASSYLDFYEQERSRSPRAMEHMAAAQRPLAAFIEELDALGCGAP